MRFLFIRFAALVAALAVVLSGCTKRETEAEYVTSVYTIRIKGGECYMEVEQPERTSVTGDCEIIMAPNFSSLADMRQAIINGSLADHELEWVIRSSSKNEDGTLRICNIDQLYECVFPENSSVHGVAWEGTVYHYSFSTELGSGGLYCGDSERFYNDMERRHAVDIDDKDTILISQEFDPERSATIYNYKFSATTDWWVVRRYICYDIQDGNKTIHIQEKYTVEMNPAYFSEERIQSQVSTTVPRTIYIWITDGSAYAYGLLTDLTDRPQVEWLSQFGLQEYVETEAA